MNSLRRMRLASSFRSIHHGANVHSSVGRRSPCLPEDSSFPCCSSTANIAPWSTKSIQSISTTSQNSASPSEASDQQPSPPAAPGTRPPTVLLFPGQGTQYIGMGRALLGRPSVRAQFEEASEVLGFDLERACLDGPEDFLLRTRVQQPAIFVCSVAAADLLREEAPDAFDACVATAGFSVGEYAALVVGGALSFGDAVRVLRVRAEAMEAASEAPPRGGLVTVFTGPASDLAGCLEGARAACVAEGVAPAVCEVANYLAPHSRVVGGCEQALEYVAQRGVAQHGLKRVKRVRVPGAFHTPLMASAAGALAQALETTPISPPRLPVYANTTGAPYDSPSQIRELLPQQVLSPVLWEQIVASIYGGDPVPVTYECGPGKGLKAILKMVNSAAFEKTINIEA